LVTGFSKGNINVIHSFKISTMTDLKLALHPTDHQEGNLNAGILLIEYGDFECPYSGRAYPLLKRLLKEKGKEFHFVFRNFPLREIHPHAYACAITAEAAGKQGKF
jgi:protein-disulfide isomerase